MVDAHHRIHGIAQARTRPPPVVRLPDGGEHAASQVVTTDLVGEDVAVSTDTVDGAIRIPSKADGTGPNDEYRAGVTMKGGVVCDFRVGPYHNRAVKGLRE